MTNGSSDSLYAAILAVFSAIALCLYWFLNPYNEAEHYYMETDVRLYYLMKISYFTLIVAAVVNARYLFDAIVMERAARFAKSIVSRVWVVSV